MESTSIRDLRALLLGDEFQVIHWAADQLGELGRAGAEVLAEVALMTAVNRDVRLVTAWSMLRMSEHHCIEPVARVYLSDSDPAFRYWGLLACVRAGLFELTPLVEALLDDPDDFCPWDEVIVIAEVAARALVKLRDREVDRDFR
jgi:HEAT repeat protein